jgi:hypothetical protein
MAPRKPPKLPLSERMGERPELGDFDWTAIESSCVCIFSADLRSQVEATTEKFVWGANTLAAAASVDDARAELKALRDAAEFVRAKLQRPDAPMDGAWFARFLFRHHIKDELLPSPRFFPPDPVRLIGGLMASCTIACDQALIELNEPHNGREESHLWKEWIRRLTRLLAGAGLPISARHDKPEASSFVAFVRELQEVIPTAFRRHTHSDLALAKAIGRARDEIRDT